MNMTDDRLSGSLQENILAVLCFDKLYAKMARYSLTVQHFESHVFREVAGIAIDYIDQFGEPVADHLPDHLEGILKGEDTRKASSYRKLIEELFAARDSINGEYVISQLHKFVRQQGMKSAIKKIVECMEDGRIDDAEVEMTKGLRSTVTSWEAGIDLADSKQSLGFLDAKDKPILMGVSALDQFGVGPAPGTVFLLTGGTNKGKSWGLIHMGKFALLQRKSVLHVTLEMSQDKVAKRYMQSIFAVTQRKGPIKVPRITKDFDGGIKTIEFDTLELPSLQDEGIHTFLENKIERRLKRRLPFKVKGYPSGTLTMQGLRAYLDGLERFEGWTPDVVIMDTLELMTLDAKDVRGSTGRLFVDFRGVVGERNACGVTGSQVNRVGISKTTNDETDLAEDISKGFTADVIVSYNQTALEQKMGMARLFVAKNRDDEGKMTALITQSYPMGQFCIDSVLMGDRYLPSLRPRNDDDDDDEGARKRTTR